MPRRFCGDSRIVGGVYWEFGAQAPSLGYSPVDMMLAVLDPPVRINVETIGLQSIGVKTVRRGGVMHVLDWVGENFYANVADFVEEAKAYGVSRRMPNTLPFEEFTAASRLLLIHRKAWITNLGMRPVANELASQRCQQFVQRQRLHLSGEMCSRFWWADVNEPNTPVGVFTRTLPGGGTYAAMRGRREWTHEPAIFASVPLSQFALVQDSGRGTRHAESEARLRASGVTYSTVRE